MNSPEVITALLNAKIAALVADIADRQRQLAVLKVQLDHPAVIPVVHYWEYLHEMSTPLWEGTRGFGHDLLRDAYGMLCGMLENGQVAPHGVSVGGCFISWGELTQQFGDPNDR